MSRRSRPHLHVIDELGRAACLLGALRGLLIISRIWSMTAPSWRRTCQLGARRSSSSDSGGGHDLGLLMGSLSRAHESLVKSRFSCKGRILIFTARRLNVSFHTAADFPSHPETQSVWRGARCALVTLRTGEGLGPKRTANRPKFKGSAVRPKRRSRALRS
jgi:hypothetical protein